MATIPTGAPEVKIGNWLKEGWEIFVADVGMFLLASLIYNILNGLCLAGLILFGPLTCGMYLMIFDRMRGGKADVKRLFEGFDYFGESLPAGFLFFLLVIIGAVVTVVGLTCIVGSLIGVALLVFIQTAFLFTFQLIVELNIGGPEAISKSYNKIRENFGQFLLFGLILWLINLAGYSVMLGWLLTTPLTLAAAAAAYRDVFGLGGVQPEAAAEQT